MLDPWARRSSQHPSARYAARPGVLQRAIEQAAVYRARHRKQLGETQQEWELLNQERPNAQRRARTARVS
jgi:hypothetical protein